MIIYIKGVHNEWGGDDLSPYLDRTYGFSINSILGQRLDTASFTLMDNLPPILTIPDKAEIIIYDHAGVNGPNTDVANTWVRGQAPIIDPPSTPPFGDPSAWTPRLFGGYVGQAEYFLDGAQRYINIHAQDYTIRLKQTVCNRAYGPDGTHSSGWLDSQMVRDLSARYLPDIDTSLVQQSLAAYLPAISFPTHSIEQFLERIRKITNAVYRIDYYKRFTYGPVGGFLAPFAISDTPDNLIPVVLPLNLLNANQSYAQLDATDWGVYTAGVTAARVTTPTPPLGLPSAFAVTTGQAGGNDAAIQEWVPITVGTAYTFCAYLRSASVRTLGVYIVWLTLQGNFLSATAVGNSAAGAGAWGQATVTATAPAGSAYALLVVRNANAAAAGELFYMTAAQIAQGSSAAYSQPPPMQAFNNLLTAAESSFEDNPTASVLVASPTTVDGWSMAGATWTIGTRASSVNGKTGGDGTFSLVIQRNSSGSTSLLSLARQLPVVGGATYTLSLLAASVLAGDTLTPKFQWYDSGGAYLSGKDTTAAAFSIGTAAAFARFSMAGQAPKLAASVQVVLTPALSATGTLLIDAVQVVRGAGTTYMNPATPNPLPALPPPPQSPSYPCEELRYAPDWTSLYNRVWIVGSVFKGSQQTYQMFPLPDGTSSVFQLPAPVSPTDPVSVVVNGVDQGKVGSLGSNQGTLDNQAGFVLNALVGYGGGGGGKGVPVVALKVTPAANSVITITATFLYPLIQIVSDAALLSAMGNVPFEKVVKDKRIDSVALATVIGNANIKAEGYTKRGGSCVVRVRGFGSFLLQPGQYISVTNTALLTGIFAGATNAFVLVGVTLTLEDDTAQPYRVALTFSDRQDASDDDVWNLLAGEQSRLNAALEQSDLATLVSDAQVLSDQMTNATETVVASNVGLSPYKYDGGANGFKWGFGKWS